MNNSHRPSFYYLFRYSDSLFSKHFTVFKDFHSFLKNYNSSMTFLIFHLFSKKLHSRKSSFLLLFDLFLTIFRPLNSTHLSLDLTKKIIFLLFFFIFSKIFITFWPPEKHHFSTFYHTPVNAVAYILLPVTKWSLFMTSLDLFFDLFLMIFNDF